MYIQILLKKCMHFKKIYNDVQKKIMQILCVFLKYEGKNTRLQQRCKQRL